MSDSLQDQGNNWSRHVHYLVHHVFTQPHLSNRLVIANRSEREALQPSHLLKQHDESEDEWFNFLNNDVWIIDWSRSRAWTVVDFINCMIGQSTSSCLNSVPLWYMYRMIDAHRDLTGKFDTLLYTHNTPISTFIPMILGNYTTIRCCDSEGSPIGRGAQFRYGLDSQYGDAKFIMKPDFWTTCALGVTTKGSKIQQPVFAKLFTRQRYTTDQMDQLNKSMRQDAQGYTFRRYALPNDGGRECSNNTSDQSGPSWCNLQAQLGCNFSFDQVLAVLLPGYLKTYRFDNGPLSFDQLVQQQGKECLKHKLIYGPYIEPSHYYAYISPTLREIDYYKRLIDLYPDIPIESNEAIESNVLRARKPFGNSSKMATSRQGFLPEEKTYMKIVITLMNKTKDKDNEMNYSTKEWTD